MVVADRGSRPGVGGRGTPLGQSFPSTVRPHDSQTDRAVCSRSCCVSPELCLRLLLSVRLGGAPASSGDLVEGRSTNVHRRRAVAVHGQAAVQLPRVRLRLLRQQPSCHQLLQVPLLRAGIWLLHQLVFLTCSLVDPPFSYLVSLT